MDIQGLGYVGIRAKSLEDWTNFGTRFLGMQLLERTGKNLALRMDDRKQRVVVSEDGGEGVAFFGWEVADAAAEVQPEPLLAGTAVTLSGARGRLSPGRRPGRAGRGRPPGSSGRPGRAGPRVPGAYGSLVISSTKRYRGLGGISWGE